MPLLRRGRRGVQIVGCHSRLSHQLTSTTLDVIACLALVMSSPYHRPATSALTDAYPWARREHNRSMRSITIHVPTKRGCEVDGRGPHGGNPAQAQLLLIDVSTPSLYLPGLWTNDFEAAYAWKDLHIKSNVRDSLQMEL